MTSPATAMSAVPALGTIDVRHLLHDMDNPLGTVHLARCAGDYTDPGSRAGRRMTAPRPPTRTLQAARTNGASVPSGSLPRFFAPQ